MNQMAQLENYLLASFKCVLVSNILASNNPLLFLHLIDISSQLAGVYKDILGIIVNIVR